MNNSNITRINKDISNVKVKIYALIAKQVEVLDHLEYSLDQNQARKNHLAYVKHILKTSYSISLLYKKLMILQNQLDAATKED